MPRFKFVDKNTQSQSDKKKYRFYASRFQISTPCNLSQFPTHHSNQLKHWAAILSDQRRRANSPPITIITRTYRVSQQRAEKSSNRRTPLSFSIKKKYYIQCPAGVVLWIKNREPRTRKYLIIDFDHQIVSRSAWPRDAHTLTGSFYRRELGAEIRGRNAQRESETHCDVLVEWL
jgi:hypothetical protein